MKSEGKKAAGVCYNSKESVGSWKQDHDPCTPDFSMTVKYNLSERKAYKPCLERERGTGGITITVMILWLSMLHKVFAHRLIMEVLCHWLKLQTPEQSGFPSSKPTADHTPSLEC